MKPTFKRFNDLTLEDINFDFQIHTNQTDGACSPEEVIQRAKELNLKSIAITEHVNMQSDWFDSFKRKMDQLKKDNQIIVYFGIEARVVNEKGLINATDNMINSSDLVLGVVHRFPTPDGRGVIPFEDMKSLGEDKALETEFNLMMALLDNKYVDVLAHPFGMYIKMFNKTPGLYLEKLLEKVRENNKVIEINTKYILDRNLFFPLLKKINPHVSIGSDAHEAKDVGRLLDVIKKEIT